MRAHAHHGHARDRRRRYLDTVLEREHEHTPADIGAEWSKMLGRFAPYWQPPAGPTLLDLGCGIGQWSHALAGLGWRAHGTDRNADFVAVARETLDGSYAHFSASASERLPYRDAPFDFCLAHYVLEHVDDWRATLREAARVLKPGGAMFIGTANILCPLQEEVRYLPCFSYLPRPLKKAALRVISARFPSLVGHSLTPALNWFSPTGLRRFLLRECGFAACYDLIDLVQPEELAGRPAIVRGALSLLKRSPYLARNAAYVFRPSLVVLAVKGGRPEAP